MGCMFVWASLRAAAVDNGTRLGSLLLIHSSAWGVELSNASLRAQGPRVRDRWPTCSNSGKEERAALQARATRPLYWSLSFWKPSSSTRAACSEATLLADMLRVDPVQRSTSDEAHAVECKHFPHRHVVAARPCLVPAAPVAGSCDPESLQHGLRSVPVLRLRRT